MDFLSQVSSLLHSENELKHLTAWKVGNQFDLLLKSSSKAC